MIRQYAIRASYHTTRMTQKVSLMMTLNTYDSLVGRVVLFQGLRNFELERGVLSWGLRGKRFSGGHKGRESLEGGGLAEGLSWACCGIDGVMPKSLPISRGISGVGIRIRRQKKFLGAQFTRHQPKRFQHLTCCFLSNDYQPELYVCSRSLAA